MKAKLTPHRCPVCMAPLVTITRPIYSIKRKAPIGRRLRVCQGCNISVILHPLKPLTLMEIL